MNKLVSCNVLRLPKYGQKIAACTEMLSRKESTTAGVYPEGWDKAKPFEAIPGPKGLPIIGNSWRYMFGKMSKGDFVGAHQDFHEQYGDIIAFRDQIGLPDYIFLYGTENIEHFLRNDGKWPIRDGMNSMFIYRNIVRKDIFGDTKGILNAQGEEWQHIRSKVNPIFMQPRTAMQYIGIMNDVGTDFLNHIKKWAQENNGEMPANFDAEINKWAFESIGVIALDARLGCLDDPPNKEAEKMTQYMVEIFKMMMIIDFMPFGKCRIKFNTPFWKKYVSYLDYFTNMALKYINEAEEKIKSSQEESTREKSVFEKLLLVDKKIAMVMTLDMLSAGIDTTGKQTAASLYYLAKNTDAQTKLREELKRLMPTPDTPITSELLNNAPYLKAVVKETGRMAPISLGHIRKLRNNVVISGYQVPAETTVLALTLYVSLSDKHYFKAKEFIPDRWLKTTTGELSHKNVSPFITLPFGFGPRSCVGQRFANLEMHIIIAKIVRNFELSWPHADMKFGTDLLYGIKDPLKIHMKPITE